MSVIPGAGPECRLKHEKRYEKDLSSGVSANFILYIIASQIKLLPRGPNPKLKISCDL